MSFLGTDRYRTMYLKRAQQQFGRAFLEVYGFTEGLGAVRDRRGAYFLDSDGKPVSAVRYRHAYPYSDGLAAVEDELGMFHIDHAGDPAYSRRFGWVSDFHEGLCAVRYLNGKYTHIDRDGNPRDQTYRHCSDYHDGTAVVLDDEGFTFVDREGRMLHDAHYDQCGRFDGGMAPVRKDGKWHLVDRSGKRISEDFDYINEGRNGLVTAVRDGSFGYFDRGLAWCRLFDITLKPELDEVPQWTDDILSHEWDSCVVFMRHSERRSHFLCDGDGVSGTGLTHHGDDIARMIGRKISALKDRKVRAHCSPSIRCVMTANCIIGAMGTSSDVTPCPEVGPEGTAFISRPDFFREDQARPSTLEICDQIAGNVIDGWYTNERIFRNLMDMMNRMLAEDDALTFCINHDIFVIPLIAYVTGRFPENDWVEYCEGCLLLRKGNSVTMVWRGEEYPVRIPEKVTVDIGKVPTGIVMNLPEPGEPRSWQYVPADSVAWTGHCSDGMYTVCDREGRFFHGRSDCYRTYNRTFSYAEDFSEQCAPVYKNGIGATYITDFGDYLHNRWFTACRNYREGAAPVMENGAWHFIDADGKRCLEGDFSDAFCFNHGLAPVFVSGRPCILSRDGKVTEL